MKTKNTHYRQGDVLVERIAALPKNAKKMARENGRIILAHGEVTGHAHAVSDHHATQFADEAGVTFLEIRDAIAALKHDEHSTIALPPGNYLVIRQREYSPTAIRNVAD